MTNVKAARDRLLKGFDGDARAKLVGRCPLLD